MDSNPQLRWKTIVATFIQLSKNCSTEKYFVDLFSSLFAEFLFFWHLWTFLKSFYHWLFRFWHNWTSTSFFIQTVVVCDIIENFLCEKMWKKLLLLFLHSLIWETTWARSLLKNAPQMCPIDQVSISPRWWRLFL